MRFSKFFFQNTTIAIHISNCDYVAFNNPKLNELQLKEVSVKSVNEVRVGPKILKRVDKIFIENVNKLVLEESALESLESKSVQFVNCTFSPFTKNIKPSRIQSEFIFYRSTLPSNFEIYLKENGSRREESSFISQDTLAWRVFRTRNFNSAEPERCRLAECPGSRSQRPA